MSCENKDKIHGGNGQAMSKRDIPHLVLLPEREHFVRIRASENTVDRINHLIFRALALAFHSNMKSHRELHPDNNLVNDFYVSHADRKAIKLELEEEFNIQIPAAAAMRWVTLADIHNHVAGAIPENQ